MAWLGEVLPKDQQNGATPFAGDWPSGARPWPNAGTAKISLDIPEVFL
jgi:hypothetical protein